jgi:DNA-binding transcriptional regulator YhcF (GntR family)
MAMNKHRTRRAKRHRYDGPNFVQLFHYMLRCPAYVSLSAWARAALIEVHLGFNGGNNGKIILSVRAVAKRIGCHRDTAGRALQELIDKGFIEPRFKGAFSVKFRRATEWRLTDRRCHATGEPQSQAFMKWREPAERLASKAKTRSYRLGPYGPTEQDTTPVPKSSPRSYGVGH